MLGSAALASVSAASSAAVDKYREAHRVRRGRGAKRFSVTVSAGVYTVSDTGSTIATGTGCTSLGPGVARCTAVPGGPIGFLLVRAGDGDDTVTLATTCPTGWTPERAPTS